jgi:hypothetical protein
MGGAKTMLRADTAKVDWSSDKKQWHVEIVVGAEVMKRWAKDPPHEADDETLRSLALATAKDEGYELDATHVTIVR